GLTRAFEFDETVLADFCVTENDVSREIPEQREFIGQAIGRTDIRDVGAEERCELLAGAKKRLEVLSFVQRFLGLQQLVELADLPPELFWIEDDGVEILHGPCYPELEPAARIPGRLATSITVIVSSSTVKKILRSVLVCKT